ncbi:hypothetical protein BGZ94_006053 [Podila epigama]|nr:hypothetical protein BGZ94_006053 [Podila epigama]
MLLPAQDLVVLAKSNEGKNGKHEAPTQEALYSVLTRRHQLGLPYTRIGSSTLVAMNPNQPMNIYTEANGQLYIDLTSGTTTTTMMMAESGNNNNNNINNSNNSNSNRNSTTTSTLEPHVFELASTMYYHMRRTEQDQGVVLSGIAGSGKTTSQRHLVQQLIRLGCKGNQDSKIGTQIRASRDLLEAFGSCKSDHGPNGSCHSLYLELQFKSRGRLFGAKLLPFMLNQEKVTDAHRDLGSYQVFYSMFRDISNEDRKRLRLGNNVTDYPYLPYHPHLDSAEQHRDLTPAFAALGFKPKIISQIWQLLAVILHLGRIDFVDSAQDPSLMGTIPKQKQTFDLVADLLGVEQDALQQALSYKRKMIAGDMCTVILDANSAKKQCAALARALYSLLFTSVVESMNKQMCKRQEDQVSFIGILDMPGFDTQSPTGFENFCTNFCNEALQGFVLQKALVEDPQTLSTDGLEVVECRMNDRNVATMDLLCGLDTLTDASPRGLVRFLHEATLKAGKQTSSGEAESSSMLPGLNRSFQSNASFISGSTYASSFGIRHYAGEVQYNLESFFVKNQDIMSPDFLTLFQTSTSSFMQQMLESNPSLVMESHPRSKETIVKAQLSSMPLRQPSVRKNKQTQVQARRKGKPTNTVSTVIKQLHSTIRDICASLDDCQLYQIIHLRPNNKMNQGLLECDPVLLRSQIESFDLATLVQSKMLTDYCVSFDHASFLRRYKVLFERQGIPLDSGLSPIEQCKQSVVKLGWSVPADGAVGREYVWIALGVWKVLEDGCAQIEKAEGGSLGFEVDAEEQREFSNLVSPRSKSIRHQTQNQQSSTTATGDESSTQFLTSYRPRAQSDTSEVSEASHSYPAVPDTMAGFAENQSDYHHRYHPGLDSPTSENKTIDSPAMDSERQLMFQNYDKGEPELKRKPTLALHRTKADESVQPPKPKTKTRRIWVGFVWLNTFWIPSFCLSLCGRMKRPDVQMAWREKVTLCLIVFWLSAIVIFFIIGLPKVVCPTFDEMYNPEEIKYHNEADNFWVSIYGTVYDITKFAKNDHSGKNGGSYPSSASFMLEYAGMDLSSQFPVDMRWACPNLVTQPMLVLPKEPFQGQHMPTHGPSIRNSIGLPWDTNTEFYSNIVLPRLSKMKKGRVAIKPEDFYNQTGPNTWAKIDGKIYDLTAYLTNVNPTQGFIPDPTFKPFLDKAVVELFTNNYGTDITKEFKKLPSTVQADTKLCLDRAFYVGVLDERNSIKCQFGNWVLVGASALMGGVILIKFLAALQLTSKRDPVSYDKFVICQVPCYTEGEESLKKTLSSLAALDYDDKRKLLLVIADGMIVGSGNEQPTPKIVLDLLGWKPTEGVQVEPVAYKALGLGGQQLNCCKVYSGLYDFEGHMVPYLVVAKVGAPNETSKPGNRGKRDSQLILMNFLNSIHTGKKMCPLELEMYHHMKNIIGVHPNLYEYILQVDADTEVMPDSLNRLVACMVADSKVIGLCGETMVANEDRSFTTMIQVYEYYISHHLAKSFESLFGSVTCLPGCFSMYRILTTTGKPLVISNKIVADYSHNDVDTLHKRNLLSLGEDRYLTTLMMKYFPGFKLKFTPDATCKTVAPDKWRVLLSQRRRWINSTIHNLGELMVLSELCGFCCFSMRFIVFIDLLGTLILPASFVYLVYLIVVVATGMQPLPIVAVAILAAVYGLQALIFILKGAWQHIGWMIIYIIAMPFFSVFIPLYSFWHMDDFSWGNTRQVVDADGRKIVTVAEAQTRFDPNSVPLKSLEAFEAERNQEASGYYYHQDGGSGSVVGSMYQDEMHSSSRYDHSGMLGVGGLQSNQYSKLDSYYGRSSPSPYFDHDKSVMGGDDLVRDYYRDSNALELSGPGRHSRVPSQIPSSYIPGSAGGRPHSTTPSPAHFYRDQRLSTLPGQQQLQQQHGLGMVVDHQGLLLPQQQQPQRTSYLPPHSPQPMSQSLQQHSPLGGDLIEMNQFGSPAAPIGLGMGGVGTPSTLMGSPALGTMTLTGSTPLMMPTMGSPMIQTTTMGVPGMSVGSSPQPPPFLGVPTAAIPSVDSPMMAPSSMASSSLQLMSGSTEGMGQGPSDAELMTRIEELLTGVDLMQVTKKKVRQQLESIYGVDMTPRREFISRVIDLELQKKRQQQ